MIKLINQCTCIPGYSGRGCENLCYTFRDGIDCVQSCPANTFSNDQTMYCIGCPANCSTCSAKDECTECEENFELVGGFC